MRLCVVAEGCYYYRKEPHSEEDTVGFAADHREIFMSVLVVGTVAFDSIETPSGSAERILGGSASYFSLAASFFTSVRIVGVIGQDGAYAAYLVTRARYVHKVPDSVTQAQAALTEPLAVVIGEVATTVRECGRRCTIPEAPKCAPSTRWMALSELTAVARPSTRTITCLA